jgi:hypothetical protein
MSNLNSILRLLGAAGIGLALCAAALPATAQESQTVARDATTGQLRAATAEEQAALQAVEAKTQARVSPKPTLQKFHNSGAAGVRLTDEFLSFSTAVRTPDGKVEMICNEAHGSQPAAAHVHAAANTPVTE